VKESYFPNLISPLFLHTDGVELSIVIITTFLQAIAGDSHAVGIVGFLIFCRFLMGIGMGGD
jgi:PHS family inorganic phosphate transporter-like MFS transporter